MLSQTPPSMMPFLRRLQQHSQLTDEEARAILELPFHPIQVPANQDFVQYQERMTHSCFVLDGMVGTFGQNKRGERQVTSFFVAGDMVDLHTVVIPEAPAAIQAMVTSTILKVPHSALREQAGRHPGIAEAFWRQCVIDAAILSEWVVNVGRRDARSRLAHLFCEMACRSGRKADDKQYDFNFPITQHQLSDMVGLTPVHVNRTLKGLREDRIVDVVSRTVHISNWDRLAQIGEFDPAYLRLAADGECGEDEPRRVVPSRLRSVQ